LTSHKPTHPSAAHHETFEEEDALEEGEEETLKKKIHSLSDTLHSGKLSATDEAKDELELEEEEEEEEALVKKRISGLQHNLQNTKLSAEERKKEQEELDLEEKEEEELEKELQHHHKGASGSSASSSTHSSSSSTSASGHTIDSLATEIEQIKEENLAFQATVDKFEKAITAKEEEEEKKIRRRRRKRRKIRNSYE